MNNGTGMPCPHCGLGLADAGGEGPWRLHDDGWNISGGMIPKLYHARCSDRILEQRAFAEKVAGETAAKAAKPKKSRAERKAPSCGCDCEDCAALMAASLAARDPEIEAQRKSVQAAVDQLLRRKR